MNDKYLGKVSFKAQPTCLPNLFSLYSLGVCLVEASRISELSEACLSPIAPRPLKKH